MLRHGLPALALFSLACDSGAARKDAPAVDPKPASDSPTVEADDANKPAAKPDAKPKLPGKDRAAAAKAAAKADRSKLAASRVRFNKLLNDGRKAVKDKRLAEGIALYRQALAIDPASPKVLGELGFAAIKQDDLALAESSTRRAIDLAPNDYKGLGALYYNLGTIEEKLGKPAAARAAYERSLAVRPDNTIVQAKLAKLSVDPTTKGPSSPDKLCAEVMSEWECYATDAEIEALPEEDQEFAGQCTCTLAKTIEEGTGKSFLRAAALVEIVGEAGLGGWVENNYLAIETAGMGWQLIGEVTNGYTPGAMGISNQGSIEAFEFADLAPAPGNELRVATYNSELDSNMGYNTLDFWDAGEVMVCYAKDAKTGECASFRVSEHSGTSILMDDEEVDPDAELGETRWAFTIEFDEGKVEIAVTDNKDLDPARAAELTGSHSFAEALALAGPDRATLH